MSFILSSVLLLAIGYYCYTMFPHWFRQGYRAKERTRPIRPPRKQYPTTPVPAVDNKQKGDDFEKYVVGLFNSDSNRFKVLEWRSDKMAANGLYALSNHAPDLEMGFVDGNVTYRFAIECKWRSQFSNGEIEWAKRYQIENYLTFQKTKRIPVFVAIGVGGSPSAPDALYVTSLNNVCHYPVLFESYLKEYKRNPTHRFFYSQQQRMLY